MRELVPKAAAIAVLVNPNNPTSSAEAREVKARASAVGIELHVLNATGEDDLEAAFAAIASRRLAGLFVANDPLLVDIRARISGRR